MLVWTLVPFYWMVATSLKKDKEIYGYEATLIPRQPTLDAYRRLLTKTPFVKYVRNSTIIAVTTTLASLVFGCLGAYALARLRFPGRALIARGLVFTYLVPPALLFIPLFAVMSALRLTDTHEGLILAYLGFTVPFCTWLLMGYFRTVPKEVEECAMVDGATRIQALWRIVLPITIPGLVCAALFAFTLSWNEFIYALTFTSSSDQITASVGVTSELIRGDIYFWGQLMAGAVLGSVPIVILYVFFLDYYVSGLTAGAIK
jgi:ABC-type glycerol-3-phosphate transport system permease component